MKTNAMKILSTGVFLTALMFIGCKKGETGPAGAVGSTGPQGPVLTFNNGGFISGNLTGTQRDGTPINETINYTYYFPGASGTGSGTLDSLNATNYVFYFSRSTSDIFGNNSSDFLISTTSKTATTGNVSLNFAFEKLLSTNKMFRFQTTGTSTASATSLSYNATTGLYTGNFSATISAGNNNTNNSAIFTGSFSATMTQLVHIIKQESEMKVD